MDLSHLRPHTRQLWDVLSAAPTLLPFTLVGGTALTMHLGHRLSEDLDFAVRTVRLPRPAIQGAIELANAKGWTFSANDDVERLMEFENSGMDLLNYQQDYLARPPGGGDAAVKVTFFTPDDQARAWLLEPPAGQGGPRVASVEEVFRLKCLVCADRAKLRDWFDLYVMLSRGFAKPVDIWHSFEAVRVPQKFDIAARRIRTGKPGQEDEGYEALMPSPPSSQQIRDYLSQALDEAEVEVARLAASKPR